MFERVCSNGRLVSQEKHAEVTAEYLENIRWGLNIGNNPDNLIYLHDDSEDHCWVVRENIR
eukprot:5240867-Karenia_brevis.AAC.1